MPEYVFLRGDMEQHLLLRVKEPMAVQAQPSLLPAEAAQLPLEMLRARPAKQGEGELADRDRHQVHAHGPPVGAPCCGPWGMWKAENAETPLKGVHGVAVPGPVRSVFGVAAVVLVVQDKALPLQAVHHVGQEPCHQALLGMAEQQVHIVAVQLTPAGAPSTRLTRATQGCGSHALPGPRSKACSMPSPRAFRPPHLRKPPTSVTVAPGRMSTAAASTSCCKASASGRCTGMLSSR